MCYAAALEREFGMEEYERMMEAQPDQYGNNIERRLYRVTMECLDSVERPPMLNPGH